MPAGPTRANGSQSLSSTATLPRALWQDSQGLPVDTHDFVDFLCYYGECLAPPVWLTESALSLLRDALPVGEARVVRRPTESTCLLHGPSQRRWRWRRREEGGTDTRCSKPNRHHQPHGWWWGGRCRGCLRRLDTPQNAHLRGSQDGVDCFTASQRLHRHGGCG